MIDDRHLALDGFDAQSERQIEAAYRDGPAALALRPTGAVVPASDYALWSEAAVARDVALAYAARTRRWARLAYRRAREAGHARGQQEGLKEAAAVVAACSAESARLAQELAGGLPSLVAGVIEDILGSCDATDVAVRAVQQAVSRLGDAGRVSVRVHPDLAKPVREALQTADDHGARAIKVEADPTLDPLACVLWSDLGNVELGVAAQVRRLRESLVEARVPTNGAGR